MRTSLLVPFQICISGNSEKFLPAFPFFHCTFGCLRNGEVPRRVTYALEEKQTWAEQNALVVERPGPGLKKGAED